MDGWMDGEIGTDRQTDIISLYVKYTKINYEAYTVFTLYRMGFLNFSFLQLLRLPM